MAGFFDTLKKTLSIDDKDKNSNGIISKIASKTGELLKPEEKFEWGMKKAKGYYENKTELSTVISSINHEFSFYDETLQWKKINLFEEELNSCVEEREKLRKKIADNLEEIKSNEGQIHLNNDVILKLNKLSDSDPNKINRIKSCQNDINQLWSKIDRLKKEVKKLELEVQEIDKEITEVANQYLVDYSYLNVPASKLNHIINKYNLQTPFSLHGVPLLEMIEQNKQEEAFERVSAFFLLDKTFNNPKLAFLYGKYNIQEKNYLKALEAFAYYSAMFPEKVEVHEILADIHRELGQNEEALLESLIAEMLK